MVTGRPARVAVLGGDGRRADAWAPGEEVRIFRGRRYGGNGELKRLERSMRAGSVDRLVVLARWNGHSATTYAVRLARRLGIPFEVVP